MTITNINRGRNSRWRVAALLSISLITCAQVGLAGPASARVQIGEILHQVEAASKPVNGYAAAVHQTVTKNGVLAAQNSQANKEEWVADEDYSVNCKESGETHATKQLSSKRAAETPASAAGVATAPHLVRGGLLTVNPLAALQRVATMDSAEVVDDLYNGIPCNKITARDADFGFVLWVTKTDPTVRRLVLSQKSAVVYDTTFEYKNIKGLLVPSHVEITSPSKGIKMVQDYSGHSL